MATNYNILLDLGKKEKLIPQDRFDLCRRQFADAGLIGERHVNHIGKVFNGYDKSCNVYKEGFFDIFNRNHEEFMGLSMRGILKNGEIMSSGFNELEQEAIELGDTALDILERYDPLASLPYELYSQMPMIQSMEINTAYGIQSTHVHTKENEIIQFWKPKRERSWYDSDTFKDYLMGIVLDDLGDLSFEKEPIIKRLKGDFRRLLHKKHRYLLDQFMMHSPDKIERIGFLW
ncbi:MAG: hypothetical protein Q7R52_05070 [archaeon]|nr:hypothetical protein [archaeon]